MECPVLIYRHTSSKPVNIFQRGHVASGNRDLQMIYRAPFLLHICSDADNVQLVARRPHPFIPTHHLYLATSSIFSQHCCICRQPDGSVNWNGKIQVARVEINKLVILLVQNAWCRKNWMINTKHLMCWTSKTNVTTIPNSYHHFVLNCMMYQSSLNLFFYPHILEHNKSCICA